MAALMAVAKQAAEARASPEARHQAAAGPGQSAESEAEAERAGQQQQQQQQQQQHASPAGDGGLQPAATEPTAAQAVPSLPGAAPSRAAAALAAAAASQGTSSRRPATGATPSAALAERREAAAQRWLQRAQAADFDLPVQPTEAPGQEPMLRPLKFVLLAGYGGEAVQAGWGGGQGVACWAILGRPGGAGGQTATEWQLPLLRACACLLRLSGAPVPSPRGLRLLRVQATVSIRE